MKVAHFGICAPHGAGQYETVKDLILAERSVGLDAQFIDFAHDGKMTCREGLKDAHITTLPLSWAENADVIISHSAVPRRLIQSKPTVLALHGRPEYSFRLEYNKVSPVMSAILNKAKENLYKAYITFWPEYLFPLSRIMVERKVYYVPAPVNFDLFNPEGEAHKFSPSGSPNIVICDMWREDVIPFNLIFAAQYFKENFAKDAKLHIYGIDQNKAFNFLLSFKRLGLCGELSGLVRHIADIYRGADMVITPNIIATRIIRESLASGTPIVAPIGCKFTSYQAEPRDHVAFANAMRRCWEDQTDQEGLRASAYKQFNSQRVGEAMKKLCEGLCNGH